MGGKSLIQTLHRGAAKHSPQILIGMGIGGSIIAGVLAVRATPKALRLMDEEKKRLTAVAQKKKKNAAPVAKLTPKETVRTVWKCYIPAVAVEAASIACILGGNSMNLKRNAALATAYGLTQNSFMRYQDKVIESIGEKKEKIIRDEVAEEELKEHPVWNTEVIMTGDGNVLCYDTISCRYFYSNREYIRRIVNDLDMRMRNDFYVSLNDLYYELHLEGSSIGDDIGWHIDNGYLDITFSSKITTDGRPYLVLIYLVSPKYL